MSARRIIVVCALALAGCAPTVASAAAPPPPVVPGARIASGVTAGGVDLSGLTVTEAAARLHAALDPHLLRPVALDVGGRTFHLTSHDAKLVFDAGATAKAALSAVVPVPPAAAAVAGGQAVGTEIPLVVRHSTTAVRTFVRKVARSARRRPRSATLRIGVKHMIVRRSRYGHRVDQLGAYKRVNAALADVAASRKVHLRLVKVRAAVNTNDLANRNPTIITVQKSTRTLRLFKRLKISKRYQVAVGQPAYPTPEGRFRIQNKQINPTWSVPNSPWAGELGGTTVTGGSAANPLKARWMGITDGVGIHGTSDDASIGSAASHGCLRMHVSDVIDLYPRVPVGTPVLIAS